MIEVVMRKVEIKMSISKDDGSMFNFASELHGIKIAFHRFNNLCLFSIHLYEEMILCLPFTPIVIDVLVEKKWRIFFYWNFFFRQPFYEKGNIHGMVKTEIERETGKNGDFANIHLLFYLNQTQSTLSSTRKMWRLMNQTVKYIIFECFEALVKNSFAT